MPVFLRVYENRQKYSPSAAFSTFIWRITTNLCNDFFRKQTTESKSQKTLVDLQTQTPTNPSDIFEIDEERNLVSQAMEKLTPIQREVLVLKHFQQLKIREIAQVLETPMGTIASRLADALDRLSAELSRLDRTQEYPVNQKLKRARTR